MSANRDEDMFENPFRFDVGRDPNYHVGFGLGTHFCLGANLARLEIRVMFEEILERFERFEVTGPLAWTNNNRLLSLTELPSASIRTLRGRHPELSLTSLRQVFPESSEANQNCRGI